jgi:hypothetical protein
VKYVLALALCAASAPAIPAAAQPAGMAAMQYYVGTWSCLATPRGRPTEKATSTFTLDSGLPRQWVVAPPQGKMRGAFVFSSAVTYDADQRRFVSTYLDNAAGWEVSVAPPWNGNTERWTDLSTDSGKLSRTEIMRAGRNAFRVTAFDMKTGRTELRVSCARR